jgi:DNA transformation protein and related proteins
MASDQGTVDFIMDQLSGLNGVSARKMFGEYGVFYEDKTVALICDNQLFVKPTAPGRALAVGAIEAPAYKGAKPSLVIDPERWDDREWLSALVMATAAALPTPPPKRPRKAAAPDRTVGAAGI